MPRPGPRPYECVRRAWHSERHQPIRGSLIQEIFRIVNEVHSSATKKNKEWQEKLPIVVLKAEEIMYSKANSEAEYADLSTLWDRVNDAINTIIRIDESTETGEFMQPCIEAALHLGCTPRRSSRSQRNDTPRYYLRPETSETPSTHPSNTETKGLRDHVISSPFMLRYPDLTTNFSLLKKFDIPPIQNITFNDKQFSHIAKHVSPIDSPVIPPKKPNAPSSSWSAYPLCDIKELQSDDLKFHLKPSNSHTNLLVNHKMPKHSSYKLGSSEIISHASCEQTSTKQPEVECDLSLRLGGYPAVSSVGAENDRRQVVRNGNPSPSYRGDKFIYLSQQTSKYIPVLETKFEVPLDSSSNKCWSESENLNGEEILRKRKASIASPAQDDQLCWRLRLMMEE